MGWNTRSILVVVLMLVATTAGTAGAATATEPSLVCLDDGPYPSTGVVTRLCLTTPDAGSTLTGRSQVTATLENVGVPNGDFGARQVIFTLDGQPLLTDFSPPYSFTLPTETFADGVHVLEVSALMRNSLNAGAHATPELALEVTFDNGNVSPPMNTNSFVPSTGRDPVAGEQFVLAATGDGASGKRDGEVVSDRIESWDPNLFLYLGDVYEDGTYTEFLNWYGDSDELWGRFADITNPTVGNHEYYTDGAAGYFYYWDNPSHFYSFDAAGWHFATIDSNPVYGGLVPGSQQFEWLRQDLASNTSECTVVFFHHPVWSVGNHGSAPWLGDVWELLVGSGVDVVLTGHDHNYQRWQSLDGAGNPHPAGPTQFVAGGGGHTLLPFESADPRLAAGADTSRNPDSSGALRFLLGDGSATYEYHTRDGLILDSGEVLCHAPDFVPGSVRNSISIERETLEAMLPTGNADHDEKISKALEHIGVALETELWESDDRPSVEGKYVLDELKKAVHELEYAISATEVGGVMSRLAALGYEVARAAQEEASAAFGDLTELAKTAEEIEAGFEKRDEGKLDDALDKFKRAFEHARKALDGAPDPWTTGVGNRGAIGDVLAAVWAMSPTGDGGDDDRVESAVEELGKALELELWDHPDRPSDASDKEVPDRLKKAIDQLEDVDALDATPAILDLLQISSTLAFDAIEEAVSRAGDPGRISEAIAKTVEAEQKWAEGKYKDAADKYKQAFEKARDA